MDFGPTLPVTSLLDGHHVHMLVFGFGPFLLLLDGPYSCFPAYLVWER